MVSISSASFLLYLSRTSAPLHLLCTSLCTLAPLHLLCNLSASLHLSLLCTSATPLQLLCTSLHLCTSLSVHTCTGTCTSCTCSHCTQPVHLHILCIFSVPLHLQNHKSPAAIISPAEHHQHLLSTSEHSYLHLSTFAPTQNLRTSILEAPGSSSAPQCCTMVGW